jgi:hypothetical protein
MEIAWVRFVVLALVLALTGERIVVVVAAAGTACEAVPEFSGTGDGGVYVTPLFEWTASGRLAESRTVGRLPDAMVDAAHAYELQGAVGTRARASVRGVRIRCASADGSCLVTLEVMGPGREEWTLAMDIPDGVAMAVPTAVHRLDLDAPGHVPATVTLHGSLRCANYSAEMAEDGSVPLTDPVALTATLPAVALPFGRTVPVVELAGQRSAPGALAAELHAIAGPFDSVGIATVDVVAELLVADAADGPYVRDSDIVHTARLAVSDVDCVRSAEAWRALADGDADRLPIAAYPRPGALPVPAAAPISARQLARFLRLAGHTNLVDRLAGEATAAALSATAGVELPAPVAAAMADAAAVFAACKIDDAIVWSLIRYGGRSCAGFDSSGLLKIVAKLARFNAGTRAGWPPACSAI